MQTIVPAMTPDIPPVAPAAPSAAQALQRRRVISLALAGVGAVGLGAMLGHGLGQSLAASLPAGGAAALPALVGAAVAAVLVPLTGWAAIRIVAPALPKPTTKAAAPAAPATITRLRPVPAADTAPARPAGHRRAGRCPGPRAGWPDRCLHPAAFRGCGRP